MSAFEPLSSCYKKDRLGADYMYKTWHQLLLIIEVCVFIEYYSEPQWNKSQFLVHVELSQCCLPCFLSFHILNCFKLSNAILGKPDGLYMYLCFIDEQWTTAFNHRQIPVQTDWNFVYESNVYSYTNFKALNETEDFEVPDPFQVRIVMRII